jgi:hypothetical protein
VYSEVRKNYNNCPHTHKASIILDSDENSEEFLSRHYEKCEPCREKLNSLKESKALLTKQIPFSPAPKEIKELFRSESIEMGLKIKKRIKLQKKKRFEDVLKGSEMFLADFKKSLLSKSFLFTSFAVASFWIYSSIFN